MGNSALACFRATAMDAAADGGAALLVSADLAGLASRDTPLRVPLGRAELQERALWTARVVALKRALVGSLRKARDVHATLAADARDEHVASESASRVYVAVLACGRCGRPSDCDCGWRREHVIPPALESRSLMQLLPRLLPNVFKREAGPPRLLHLRLFESECPPNFWLEAAITNFKVVDPMVERPRAVFRVDVQFGEQKWSVSRRFQDFARLQTSLTVAHGEAILPELPPTTWLRRLDDEFLHDRRKALERYLCSLLLIDGVCDSVELLSFLGAVSTNQETLLRPGPDSLSPTEVLHLRVLQHYVRAGDLLLFQSHGLVSSLQRSATGSEWDHVAIVVPRASDDDNKGFLLLEATGDGVTAFSLTSRLYAYSTFHTRRISVRRLHTPLISDIVRSELLARFTERVKGRPYGLSVSKVLRTNESQRMNSRHPSWAMDAGYGDDYFCSELIADAYKALGLVGSSIPSSNFWPSSFAPGAFMDVEIGRHGASLGNTIAVDCLMLEVALASRVVVSGKTI